MLLIAVVAMLPALDAFSCALEPATGHSMEMVAADDASTPSPDKDDAGGGPHGVCAHNHCHHSTGVVPSNDTIGEDILQKGASLAFQDDGRLANVSDGLMRPPRI